MQPEPTARWGLTPEQQRRENEASKRVVLLTVFLDILGFGIIIPQLGIYAAQFGASPFLVGILASMYSMMGFIFTPFWGRLSDRIGRRPVLLYSILGTSFGYVLFALAGSLPWLFAARIVDGITAGNISTAQAYLSDLTPPEERSKTFGIFGAIFGVGFAIGPAIGAALTHLPGVWGGNLGIGAFTAGLSFLNWLLAIKRLPETLTPAMRSANAERHAERGGKRWQLINVHGYKRAFELPGLNIIMAVSFFSVVAFATLQGTFTLYIIMKYVRPQVQTEIRQNPQQAAAQAQTHLAHAPQGGDSAPATEESSFSTATSNGQAPPGDVTPYSPALGGDFNLPDRAPPAPNLSWRHIEQILVQPAAAKLVNSLFTTIGILALIVQGSMIGPLKKRFGELNLVIAGTLLMALALALVPLPHEFYWQFPIAGLTAIGNSISAPVLTALVSLLTPEHERGEIMGVFQSTQSLGRIIGPILGGILFNTISYSAPYFAGGAIMMVAFALSFKLKAEHLVNVPVSPEPAQ